MKKLCARCNYYLTENTYCGRCSSLVKKELSKNKKRPDKFYKSAYWKTLRALVLVRDKHLCQMCLKKGKFVMATEIDHIIPLKNGGTNDIENLQALCKRCHSKKTKVEQNEKT